MSPTDGARCGDGASIRDLESRVEEQNRAARLANTPARHSHTPARALRRHPSFSSRPHPSPFPNHTVFLVVSTNPLCFVFVVESPLQQWTWRSSAKWPAPLARRPRASAARGPCAGGWATWVAMITWKTCHSRGRTVSWAREEGGGIEGGDLGAARTFSPFCRVHDAPSPDAASRWTSAKPSTFQSRGLPGSRGPGVGACRRKGGRAACSTHRSSSRGRAVLLGARFGLFVCTPQQLATNHNQHRLVPHHNTEQRPSAGRRRSCTSRAAPTTRSCRPP